MICNFKKWLAKVLFLIQNRSNSNWFVLSPINIFIIFDIIFLFLTQKRYPMEIFIVEYIIEWNQFNIENNYTKICQNLELQKSKTLTWKV